MNRPSDSELVADFVEVFVGAVMDYVITGEFQGIDFDPASDRFVYGPMEEGTSPTDTGLWIGVYWRNFTGPMPVISDAQEEDFDADALREALKARAAASADLAAMAPILAHDRRLEASLNGG